MNQKDINELKSMVEEAKKSTENKNQLDKLDELYYVDDYAERGKSKKPKALVFADWNDESEYVNDESEYVNGERVVIDNTIEKLQIAMEEKGYDCQWIDEWLTCDECGKAFRCVENSYNWTMYGHIFDGECICGNCIRKNPDPYIEYLVESHARANTILSDKELRNLGYSQINGIFENGWYGVADSPEFIKKALEKQTDKNILFNVVSVSQFNLNYTVWVNVEDEDEIDVSQFHKDYREQIA